METKIIKISLYNDFEMEKWDDFIKAHPKGTPFHLSCWLKTINKTYEFIPFLYVCQGNNNDFLGVFPCFLLKNILTKSRIVSLPFSDYGGPLVKDNILEYETELVRTALKEHRGSVKYFEVRNNIRGNLDLVCHNYYKRHILALQRDPSEIYNFLDKRTIQYSIRKAEKTGVKIKENNTLNGMEEFYKLNMLTRKKHGVPHQPKIFFKNLLNEVILNGYGFILQATYNSNIIASSIFLNVANQIYYKFNASDPESLKKTTPNHLLTWELVKKGVAENYHFIDFGRTSPDNPGLIRYKDMWGMKCTDLPYYYYPKIAGASSTEESKWHYKAATKMWRLIPNAATEKLSTFLYRYLG